MDIYRDAAFLDPDISDARTEFNENDPLTGDPNSQLAARDWRSTKVASGVFP